MQRKWGWQSLAMLRRWAPGPLRIEGTKHILSNTYTFISLLLLIPLAGCGSDALEQAFSADPEARRWEGRSPTVSTAPPSPTPSTLVPKGERKSPTPPATPAPDEGATDDLPSTTQTFDDLEQTPAQFQRYVADLARLEVLTPAAAPNDDTGRPTTLFAPNQPMTKGTFARWLVTSNNRLYRERPSRQIRLATSDSAAAFTDVPSTSPLFPYIQGLAEAGYLPSTLTGDSEQVNFNADQPLDRETLLTWKVPVDWQQILPTATADKLQQVWGFKDANKISPAARSAILADHGNGELANIRRMVGSALLLQPQKPVTRAEAAAALWFIGVDGKGFSAKDILRSGTNNASSGSS